MESRRMRRLDRFDLKRAVLLWRKQILGMNLARIEEKNQRLSIKLLSSRAEQLARKGQVDVLTLTMDNISQQKRPLEASSQAMRKHLCMSLDDQIETTAQEYIDKCFQQDVDAHLSDVAKAGDLCLTVTVTVDKTEYVVNLSETLTYKELLQDMLQYLQIAGETCYQLIEDNAEPGTSGWSAAQDPMDFVYLPPNEAVQRHCVQANTEQARIRIVQVPVPGYEALRHFAPMACFKSIRNRHATTSDSEDDDHIFSRFVLPHVWSLLWLVVIASLSAAVVLECDVSDQFNLHEAIEGVAENLSYGGHDFKSIATWADAIKYIYVNINTFNHIENGWQKDLLSMDDFTTFRQHRSRKGGSCCVVPSFTNESCYCDYSLLERSKTDYGLNNEHKFYDTGVRAKSTFFGKAATYDSSGFHLMINNSATLRAQGDGIGNMHGGNRTAPGLYKDLYALARDNYVTKETRAVIVQTRFVAKAKGIMGTQILLFEFDITGHITPSYIFMSQPLKGGPEWDKYVMYFYFNLGLNCCSIVLLILDTRARMREAILSQSKKKKQRGSHKTHTLLGTIWASQYLTQQAVTNLLLIFSMVLKILVMRNTEHVDAVIDSHKFPEDSDDWPKDMAWVAMMLNQALIVDSFALFVTMGVLIDKLRIFATFWIQVRTIEIAMGPFLQIVIIMSAYCTLLALIAHVMFGGYNETYSTYQGSLLAMMRTALGQMSEYHAFDNVLLKLVFTILGVFPMFWLYCSVFFAVYLDAYWIASEDYEELCQEKYIGVLQLQIFQVFSMYTKLIASAFVEKAQYVDIEVETHQTIVEYADDDDNDDLPSDDDNEPPDVDEKKAIPNFRMVLAGDGSHSLEMAEM